MRSRIAIGILLLIALVGGVAVYCWPRRPLTHQEKEQQFLQRCAEIKVGMTAEEVDAVFYPEDFGWRPTSANSLFRKTRIKSRATIECGPPRGPGQPYSSTRTFSGEEGWVTKAFTVHFDGKEKVTGTELDETDWSKSSFAREQQEEEQGGK
jgi:hypothetical protein